MSNKDQLTPEEGRYLLKVARQTIEQELSGKSDRTLPKPVLSSTKFGEPRGTFVTLTMDHDLRGCVGYIIPPGSLLDGIKQNAINAAFHDGRFRPLSKNEFENIKIEVSILTEPKPLAYANADDLLKKIRPGVDGLIIKKGYHQATFLPQVWEQLPDAKEFLEHLCMKAGLNADEWKKGALEVQTYQVQAFEEEE
jgi:AmmeMemoRadiSam system protein A